MTQNRISKAVSVILLTILSAGCGMVSLGNGSSANDPIPAGTVVAQGSLQGVNSETVSGSVIVYSNNGAYTVRIQSASIPQQNGLVLRLIANGSLVNLGSVTVTSGNKNYTTGISGAYTFTELDVFSTIKNLNIGEALLSAP